MKLPYLENAYVPEAKIVEYLLNLKHEDGGGKAIFFLRFGFTIEQWEVMAAALLMHVGAYEVAGVQPKPPTHINYSVEGAIVSPDGRNPQIRTVWAIDTDSTRPRFVTAYPL